MMATTGIECAILNITWRLGLKIYCPENSKLSYTMVYRRPVIVQRPRPVVIHGGGYYGGYGYGHR